MTEDEAETGCSAKTKGYGFTIEATVKSVKGTCGSGHKVGDKIVFDGRTVKGEMCFSALLHLLPIIHALAWGAEFPWDEHEDVSVWGCPDSENLVTFELRRDRSKPWYVKKPQSPCPP